MVFRESNESGFKSYVKPYIHFTSAQTFWRRIGPIHFNLEDNSERVLINRVDLKKGIV